MTKMTARLAASARDVSQSLFSLSFNMAGLVAGALIASYFDLISAIPWALVIYPGILSIRGAIGGLFSGRVSTALHIGTIKPRFTENTRYAGVLFHSITALTLISSVAMGSVGSLFSLFVAGATALDALRIMLAVTATMGASIVFISPITFWVSVVSYRRGLNPDIVVYPVISTVADIVVTACYLATLGLVIRFPEASWWVLGLVDLVFVAFVGRRLREDMKEEDFVETIREFLITLFFVSLIVNVTGSALSRITESIGRRPEVYMIYPALIDTVGDVGSIVGSTATTKMALGLIPSRLSSMRQHLGEIRSAWAASVVMFGVYSVTSSLIYGIGVFRSLFLRLIATNLLVIPIIVMVSYAVAIETRRRGMDPDNFIIPIETSLSDGITTIALLLVISLGVG